MTVSGCDHCGATWNLNELLYEAGVKIPAVMRVFIAALHIVNDRLEYEHGKCKAKP